MYHFIIKRKPKSYNNWKRGKSADNYKESIKEAIYKYNKKVELMNNNLYGCIYYFCKNDTSLDADNISKPLWDSLQEIIYNSDNQVKIRIAGIFDLSKNNYQLLNSYGMPGFILDDFLEALENEDNFIYVACGELKIEMYRFDFKTNGN